MSLYRVLNPDNKPFSKYAYKVVIGVHYSFDALVFADCLQDAIDYIVDGWEKSEEENPGYFLSEEELSESDFSEEEYISGGNHGRVTSFCWHEMQAEEMLADSVELYAEV